jgi:hypothetical protein
MPHVAIEHVIMVPVLILQIALLPLMATSLMNVWADSSRTLALQDAAGQMGSTMQQMYFSMNRETMLAGTMTQKSNLPTYIDNYPYTGNATLNLASVSTVDSSKVLTIMLRLTGVETSVETSVVLGQNVLWQESIFTSNSLNACFKAEKLANNTIVLSFGG